MGELKGWEDAVSGIRVLIRHMPDAPLLADPKTWARVLRSFAPLIEAADSHGARGLRLVLAALFRARRENTYEIDRASVMLSSEEWIPLEGVHQPPLIRELVRQERRFSKPLQYAARTAAGFADAILLDAGAETVALHVVSAFTPADRQCKERAIRSRWAGKYLVGFWSEA